MMLMLLTVVLGYELKIAVGTSVFIMTFTALSGSISHFTLQGVIPDFTILLMCVTTTLIFALLGAKFANKASPKILHRMAGSVLASLGIVMLVITYLS